MLEEKSFYNLDYVIEINETRLAQYTAIYQKNTDKLTNLIIIYSGIAVFLTPISQDLLTTEKVNYLFLLSFICFVFPFGISLIFAIKLIIPIEIASLDPPKVYYATIIPQYEALYPDNLEFVKRLAKSSYIDELEQAITMNAKVSKLKGSFYYKALIYSLLSALPYLVCVGIYFSQKANKTHHQTMYSKISIN